MQNLTRSLPKRNRSVLFFSGIASNPARLGAGKRTPIPARSPPGGAIDSQRSRVMNIDLAGKKAIVTGGSRGIGRAIALAFARAGAHVSICARGAEALEAARAEIATNRVTAHAAACNLADGEAVARYIADAAEALGGIDI